MTPNPSSSFEFRRRRIRISNLRIAVMLSLVLHAILFWSPASRMIFDHLQPFDESEKDGKPAGSLSVRMVQPTSRRADEAPQVPRAPVMSAPRSVASRPVPTPPRLAAAPPVLSQPSPSPSSAPAPQPQGDLAAYIEQRRRSREDATAPAAPPSPSASPGETEQERDNRQVAENLGFNRVPTFGAGRKSGGGVFQIQRVGYDSAEFFFFGFNKLIKRNAQQMIEVRRGDNPTMELAVVRRMIAIIREQSSGDIIWDSTRLRREVTLSARPGDNAGLEDFLMKEFFSEPRRR